MSLLKQLDRAARTAWCPSSAYPTLLATGTIAGTIDDSFVTKSALEVWDLDLASPSGEMKLLGAIESKDCFHSVSWGAKGIDDGTHSHGLLAGGMSDGSINLWSVGGILNRSADALLSRSEVHKGQVLGLQFHPSQPNLLASGATDGEVFMWDLANLRAPTHTKPNPALKTAGSSGITSIAWNKNAPQILASASEVGETTVWDLRQKRSIITIRNSARMNVRTSGLAWNPAAGVQLAVCYNNYPVAEVWDLRQSMTPKTKLEGFHQGSVLSLDWCPNDPSVLVTVGEDARMASWNPLTGAFLLEYPAPANSNVAFDVSWSPKQPNVLATSSYDGKVNILSVNSTGPNHVPAWMTRPIGVTFGFGGKLASFGLDAPPPQPAAAPTGGPPSPHKPHHPKVQLQQLVTDPEVLDKAAGLQTILKEGDFPSFCAWKITHSTGAAGGPGGDDDEKTIWTFMKILFEDEVAQRYLLLKELGFEPPATSDIVMPQPSVPVVPNITEEDFFNQSFPTPKPAEGASGAEGEGALGDNKALASALDGITEGKEPEGATTNGLVAGSSDGSVSSAAGSSAAGGAGDKDKPFVEDADDKAIRQALVFGDFKAAVAKCLAVGRMADAIIFASFGPPPLWEETRAQYFAQHKMPFIRNVMRCISAQALEDMVRDSDLGQWKETLAICITYTTAARYRQLVNQLGARLEDAGKNIPAVVCYICSSNIDKAIEMWTSKIPAHVSAGAGGSALLGLHAAIEKIAVFAHATNAHQQAPQQQSKVLSLKYAEYANMLASQGELRGAFNYLSRVATPNDPNSAVLLDRIFHAESEQFVREQYAQPAFPFPVEQVLPDPTLAHTLHQQALAKQQRQQQLAAQAQQQAMQAQNRNHPPAGAAFPQQFNMQPQQQQQQQRPGAPYGQQGAHPAPSAGAYGQQMGQQQGGQMHPGQGGPPGGAYGQQGAHGQHQQQGQYGAPQQQYGAPQQQQPQQPKIFQPQQPQYGAPPPQQHQAPPQQHGYGATAQPQQPGYGAPLQQNYGVPNQFGGQQGGQFGATQQPGMMPGQQPPQPQRPPQQAPAPYQAQPAYGAPAPQQPQQPAFTPAPAQPAYNPAPSQPAYGAPAVQPGFGAPQPAAVPAQQPKPFQPAPMVPTSAAPAPAAAAPAAAEAPIVLSPADQALMSPLENCLAQLSAVGLKTPEQKKVSEIRSKLQDLAKKMQAHELTPTATAELQQLSMAVQNNDFTAAQRHHLNLVKTDWANNNEWLLGLKTMLLMCKKYLEKTG